MTPVAPGEPNCPEAGDRERVITFRPAPAPVSFRLPIYRSRGMEYETPEKLRTAFGVPGWLAEAGPAGAGIDDFSREVMQWAKGSNRS